MIYIMLSKNAMHYNLLKLNKYVVFFKCRYEKIQCRQLERNGISNYRGLGCLLKLIFMCSSKKTSKPRITGLYEGNPPVISGFPSQRDNNVENISIWWRHHEHRRCCNSILTPNLTQRQLRDETRNISVLGCGALLSFKSMFTHISDGLSHDVTKKSILCKLPTKPKRVGYALDTT